MINPKIYIPEDDQELLSECKVETMRASGSGGQHVNTTDSAVRLTHIKTEIVVRIQNYRSQHRNKAHALSVLRERLEELNKVEKKRIKTKTSRSVKRKNKESKQKQSKLKQGRKKVTIND